MSFTSFTLLATVLLLISLTSVPTEAERHSLFGEGGEGESHCAEVLRHIGMLVRQYGAATASEAHRGMLFPLTMITLSK